VFRRAFAHAVALLKSSQLRRIERVAMAAEQLARLDELDLIIARSESHARDLLPCDEARITLGFGRSGLEADSDFAETLRISLPAPRGGRLGWMTAARRRGPAFTADDEAVFEHLARSVTLAVQAGLRAGEVAQLGARNATLLSRMSDGVVEFDPHLNIISMNEAAARSLQFDPGDGIVGTNLWDLVPGNGAGEFGALCQTALDTGRPVWATGRFVSLKSCFDLRAFPHPDGLTALFRDVTAERAARQRRRHFQRLETIGQLTAGVAHDVNNLLTVMLGSLELLGVRAQERQQLQTEADERNALLTGQPDDREDTDLTLATGGLRAGESATQLIRRLLAYSRGQPALSEAIDVAELLRAAEPMIRKALGGHIRLRIACAADLWPAIADPAELESAVLNMALNAQAAMPGGGLLEIAAENVEVDRLYAKVGGFERTGAFVMLSVVDNGAGMTAETLEHAFDAFFTTKAAGQGAGLGLSMVQGFARQSGGHVLLDSEPGQGTILRVYLRRARKAPAALPEPWPIPPGPPERSAHREDREHVLLVEDNAMLRGHADRMLRGLGYQVSAVPTAAAALAHLAEGGRADLLLTDVVLAGEMTGPDLARAATRLRPGMAVLFTSGYGGGALVREGMLPDEIALLPKPFRRGDLAAAVRSRLDASPRPAQRA
jgi:signal transduction histidine kinase/PAS domain-containing protein/ActR/RegA family two-component response regulator